MEIEYGELLIGINEKYGEEILVETSVETSERGGASKVLSVEADVKATGAELLDGEADVSGKVNYRLLYLDKQGHLCGLDYFKDFKCRVAGEKIAPNGNVDLSFDLPDVEARINGDDVELSAVVDVALRYFGEQSKKTVSGIGEAECLSTEIVSECVKKGERLVEVEKESEIGVGVKKIVLFSAQALPLNVVSEGEEVTVSGEVLASVLYLSEADEVVELSLTLPYAEKFENQGKSSYAASVKNARIILTDGEEGNSLEVEATVAVREFVCREIAQRAIRTACGEKECVEETREAVDVFSFGGQGNFTESLSGLIPLSEENAYVAFVRPGAHAVAEVTVSDGEVNVVGVAAFQVVYQTEEGYRCTQGELPFAYELPLPVAKAGERAEIRVCVSDAKATFDGKAVAITAKISFDVTLFENSRFEYLSDAKAGDPIPESEAGISVYFAEKGENLYDIARSMGVLPSALLAANPFLSEPITEKKKVLIFRKK